MEMKSITLAFPAEGIEISDAQIKSVLHAALLCYSEFGAGGKKRRPVARALAQAVERSEVHDYCISTQGS